MKFLLKIILAIALLIIGFSISDFLKPELIGGGIILLLTTLIIDGGEFTLSNRNRLGLILKVKWLAIKGKYIRFSMSYQYRIKVNDKYLLVKNSNPSWNWYQHVGGKYKRIDETQKVLKDLDATDDLKLNTNGLKKCDLAVFVPAKNAIKFLDWFNSNKEREISHWRECYEELLGGKAEQVLSNKYFPYINYRFVKSVRTPVKRAPIDTGWNCWEILQYDVLDLIPTPEQQVELEDLLAKGDTEYIKWASTALINRLGYDEGKLQIPYKISPHAKWVLNLKWSQI